MIYKIEYGILHTSIIYMYIYMSTFKVVHCLAIFSYNV